MWYEILINGYSWFVNDIYQYGNKIKIADCVGGILTECSFTKNETSQINFQLDDYQQLGFNKRLAHLGRTGITKI